MGNIWEEIRPSCMQSKIFSIYMCLPIVIKWYKTFLYYHFHNSMAFKALIVMIIFLIKCELSVWGMSTTLSCSLILGRWGCRCWMSTEQQGRGLFSLEVRHCGTVTGEAEHPATECSNLHSGLSYEPWILRRNLLFPSLLLSLLIHKMNCLCSVRSEIPFSLFSLVIMLQTPPLNIDFFWFSRLLGFQGFPLKCIP